MSNNDSKYYSYIYKISKKICTCVKQCLSLEQKFNTILSSQSPARTFECPKVQRLQIRLYIICSTLSRMHCAMQEFLECMPFYRMVHNLEIYYIQVFTCAINKLLCYNVCLHVCVLKWEPLGVFQPSVHSTDYDSLKTKICPHLSSKLVHSFSHLNTVLLCVQSVPNIKKALVTVNCLQLPHQQHCILAVCNYTD